MGENNYNTIRVDFDRKIKVIFNGEKVTSDGGVIALAELDNKLGLIKHLYERIEDNRVQHLTRHSIENLIKERLFCIAAGYEDGDDADELRDDPAMKRVSRKGDDSVGLASQPSVSRLENELLADGENLEVITDESLEWAIMFYRINGNKRIQLDVDSSNADTHGKQEGSVYNAHFGSTCYHPLILQDINYGIELKTMLRPGNVYTSDDVCNFLRPVFERLSKEGFKDISITADSGFATPEFYELCEEYNVTYFVRLKSNAVLERAAIDLMTRPRGRPGEGPLVRYKGFSYQAGSWNKERRVVVKSVHQPDMLFADIYFIVTNSKIPNKEVYRRYNRRGKAEQRIDEGKNTIHWNRLSCHTFEANCVRLQLYTLAYNLMNLFRLLGMEGDARRWRLQTIRLRLIKIGARVTKRSRYFWFHMGGGKWLRQFFRRMIHRIQRLPCPAW